MDWMGNTHHPIQPNETRRESHLGVRPKLAVNDVSFNVERGNVLGFPGPDDAGKSTTLRMITVFTAPSARKMGSVCFPVEFTPAS
jgi:ABC-type multidrug transport system ATPase subunit